MIKGKLRNYNIITLKDMLYYTIDNSKWINTSCVKILIIGDKLINKIKMMMKKW